MTDITQSRLKPLMPWVGSKSSAADLITQLYEPFRPTRVVSLFAGALGDLLPIAPQVALVNDVNPHVINLYQQIQLGLAPVGYSNDAETYNDIRDQFNRLVNVGAEATGRAAQLFHWLSRHSFNGVCRFNRQGGYNSPFGRRKVVKPIDLGPYARLFARWEFRQGDFAAIELRSNDFVIADPPFDETFTKYSSGGFTWDDQVRLAEYLGRHTGPIIAFNNPTPRIMELYKAQGFVLEMRRAARKVSCKAEERQSVYELVALKNFGG